ncbi:hypothetical protein [Streptomyces sp. NPDC001880]
MSIQPLLEALGIQEDAARALADDLRTPIAELQGRLLETETHLEYLAITRKTVTALTDRIPIHAAFPELPEHPDYPRILAPKAASPLRARDVCEALDHELLPKNIEGTRAKLKRLFKLDILTEGTSAASRGSSNHRDRQPGPSLIRKRTPTREPPSQASHPLGRVSDGPNIPPRTRLPDE